VRKGQVPKLRHVRNIGNLGVSRDKPHTKITLVL
jgi:hypothetical protein